MEIRTLSLRYGNKNIEPRSRYGNKNTDLDLGMEIRTLSLDLGMEYKNTEPRSIMEKEH